MSNLGWLFYKEYFRGLNYADLENEENEHIIQKKVKNLITQTVTLDKDEMLGNTHFKATTTYPGLILGSGNIHELPDIKGQAILGFSFDYTSGLPIIAGSSIKGVLRSAFKYPEYIQEILNSMGVEANIYEQDEAKAIVSKIKELELEIFDNNDIFFDAVVVASGGSTLLGDDYITPHGDALKNPIPLRFIKVMPNVTFRFDFELTSGLISKRAKSELFQNILEDLGLGAKTNVGYGKFDNFRKEQTKEEQKQEKQEREEEAFHNAIKSNSLEKLEQFKRDFFNSTRDIDGAIEKIKHQNRVADIQKAFDNLNKSNKKHIESFINKYKDDSDAKEFIIQLNGNSTEQKSSSKQQGAEALEGAKNGKQFKSILHNLTIDDKVKITITQNIIRICKELNKKKKEKFFREAKLENYLDVPFKEEMMKKVNIL